jgi:hypothetical protein
MSIAGRLHEDLPQTNAMARSYDSTLRQQLSTIRVYIGGGTHPTPTPRQPLGPSRHSSPTNQGLLGTNSSRPPPWHRHRHNAILLLRSGDDTRKDRAKSKAANRTRYT